MSIALLSGLRNCFSTNSIRLSSLASSIFAALVSESLPPPSDVCFCNLFCHIEIFVDVDITSARSPSPWRRACDTHFARCDSSTSNCLRLGLPSVAISRVRWHTLGTLPASALPYLLCARPPVPTSMFPLKRKHAHSVQVCGCCHPLAPSPFFCATFSSAARLCSGTLPHRGTFHTEYVRENAREFERHGLLGRRGTRPAPESSPRLAGPRCFWACRRCATAGALSPIPKGPGLSVDHCKSRTRSLLAVSRRGPAEARHARSGTTQGASWTPSRAAAGGLSCRIAAGGGGAKRADTARRTPTPLCDSVASPHLRRTRRRVPHPLTPPHPTPRHDLMRRRRAWPAPTTRVALAPLRPTPLLCHS